LRLCIRTENNTFQFIKAFKLVPQYVGDISELFPNFKLEYQILHQFDSDLPNGKYTPSATL
jgi:hypothetical protein